MDILSSDLTASNTTMNACSIASHPGSGSSSRRSSNGSDKVTTVERLVVDIFDNYTLWNMNGVRGGMQPVQSNEVSPPLYNANNIAACFDSPPNENGDGITIARPNSSRNSAANCNFCTDTATTRCIDCNEFMCNSCLRKIHDGPLYQDHRINSLPKPIGSSPPGHISINNLTPPSPVGICDIHNEVLRYVCEVCKKLVCQCCTLHEHKEHNYASVQSFAEHAQEKIDVAIESSRTGTKCIKSSIDRALAFIRLTENNCAELSDNVRRAFPQFIQAIEDRERYLLDLIEKIRQRHLAILNDQMVGLKSALAGIAETSDMLSKLSGKIGCMDDIDLAMKISNGQRQLEQFAAIYKDLQPKQDVYAFVPPNYSLIQDIRNQGSVLYVEERNGATVTATPVLPINGVGFGAVMQPMPHPNMPLTNASTATNHLRLPFVPENSYHSGNIATSMPLREVNINGTKSSGLEWELSVVRTSANLKLQGSSRCSPAIPGCVDLVAAHKTNIPSLSFAFEGHDDAQLSRPWGLCVDKQGNILISDRRNNRVQIFNANGLLKLKFGRKGNGNGEFDLPAGICVDIDNRIIVVDKDNHRVQIFSSHGLFLSKFGCQGKEHGQFQYPWDVAVNMRRQIVVTDSRNHRVQQFDSEGRFIRQIIFHNYGMNRGIASPRGVCYTPTGNIIVSDFDNHCLYLINPDNNEIIANKGHEGSGYQEFNRPSGVCCDDEGRIIVADSKNQRVNVYSASMEYQWSIEIRPSLNPFMPKTIEEKDRTCDVAIMPDGRIVLLIELSPDSKEEKINTYQNVVLCDHQ
ncbi:protein wech-like isoform X2 [Eurosta solidaginis]|uniref:protein wech-like isoform X2 n=1 Tax=Eurosta solidaginis TaxID=178769 RepID=UPI0035310F1A